MPSFPSACSSLNKISDSCMSARHQNSSVTQSLTCFSLHTSTDLSTDSLLQTAVVGAVQFDLFLSHAIPNIITCLYFLNVQHKGN